MASATVEGVLMGYKASSGLDGADHLLEGSCEPFPASQDKAHAEQ